jgi:hypothetical protein
MITLHFVDTTTVDFSVRKTPIHTDVVWPGDEAAPPILATAFVSDA